MTKAADDARLRAFWNERYSHFTLSESGWMGAGERLNARIYACKLQALARTLRSLHVSAANECSVLDAGCGQGYFAQYYRRAFPAAQYVGVDISERAVTHLREAMPGVEFHVADLSAWTDPRNRRFDIIQSLEVLHLILDDTMFERALTRLSDLLADGGSILVTAAMPAETQQPSDYLRYRSRRMWLDTLDALKLRIVATRPIYYWLPAGGPPNRYLRWMFDRLGPDALYMADRAALTLGIPQPAAIGIDCRMRLFTIQRVVS